MHRRILSVYPSLITLHTSRLQRYFSATAFSVLAAPCPLKNRVGENSPSLWPTMFSVTKTGMNFLPLCTANVCPIMSGTTVERRDHVFTILLALVSFICSIFLSRWASTKGPLLTDLGIQFSSAYVLPLAFLPPGNDVLVGRLVLPRLITLGR